MKPYYERAGIVLFNADCREVLPTLGPVDLVLTDPPYGIGFASQPTKWQRRAGHVAEYWDEDVISGLDAIRDVGRVQIIWGGNYYVLPPSRGWLSWFKPDAPPSMASVEFAWTNQDCNARQISHSISATNMERVGHPTQKPLRVIEWSMKFAPNVKSVFDPFLGSGTTGVACAKLGRQFIGVEIEERYCELAAQRIEKELNQGTLFEPTPAPVATQLNLAEALCP